MKRAVSVAVVTVVLSACGGRSDSLPPRFEQPPQPVPARLRFSGSPWGTTAGQVLPPVTVHVEDEGGVLVSASIDVTLATSAGTLGGTTTRTSAGGVATFDDLTLTRAGSAKLVASAAGLQGAETSSFPVGPGPAASLAFDAQPPSTTTAGATIPDMTVVARDAWGNVATGTALPVTLWLPPPAGLAGVKTQWLENGVATFRGLSVAWAGSGYELTATSGLLTPATSTAFAVVPAAAAILVFAVQPAGAEAGDVIAPVHVWILDSFANLVPDSRDVTVAAEGLAGTRTVTSVGGIALFADLSVRLAGYGTLTASATGLVSTTSTMFQITPGPPASLAFSAQPPSSVAAGAVIPTVTVELTDVYANRCWSTASAVGLSLGGAELLGTTSRDLVSGLASFPGLSVRKAGTGYRLSALGAGAGPVQSSAFDVLPGAGTHLAFTAQPPATAVAGATLAPAIAVAILDAYENPTPATGGVTVSLWSPAPAGATLLGTTTVAFAAGTATFADLSLRKAATGYRLNAVRSGLPTVTSDFFTVVPAAATKLVFAVQPTSIRAGHPIAPPVQVAVTDEWLNAVTSTQAEVALALEPNAAGTALAGATTLATTDGVAAFAGITVGATGSGYRIRATAAALADAVSNAFDVAPHWESIGPDGGQVTALAADPVAGGVAYAATNGCVWKRTAIGSWWSRGCQGLAPMQIDALAVHPTATQKVFAATSLGLYRSGDGGASWSAVASLGAATPYRTLAIAVAASGAIYAGTFQDGIWRSFDDGATWEPLGAGSLPRRIKAIALEPASTDVLYAAAVDPDDVGTVYRSLDRGETWTETALGPVAFPGVQPAALLVDPGSSGTIYAGARAGLFELYDRGATAARVVSGPDVRALAAYGGSGYRYAAGTSGVWRMVVGSEAWTALGAASLPSAPNAVAVAVLTDGKLFAGTRYGPYSTTYSGSTWSPSTSALRAFNVTAVGAGRTSSGGRVVYAATFGGGVYRSLDAGASWTRGSHPAESQMFYGIAVERANPNYAWLAGASGLYRTTNGGTSWTEVFAGQGTMYSTILDPSNDAIVYAGGNSDVYRSTAGTTASFRDLNVCGGPVRAMALSATAPLALWVGTDAGMCRVDLARVNEIFVPYAWQPGTSGTTDAIAIDPDPTLAGSTVWASTSHGFHTTLDGGATWTRTNDRFNALLAQPGKLLGARSLGTVEVSRDGGATFQPASLGLYYGYVRSMADVPGVPDEIYAGTSWGGVFKTTTGGE
jgi:hypothetical protein